MLEFRNPEIVIVNTEVGAGSNRDIAATLQMPYHKGCFTHDSAFNYDYTNAVCGMVSNWCEGSTMCLGVNQLEIAFEERSLGGCCTSLSAKAETERKYIVKYNKGGCTFGDMCYTRHRNVKYINAFPCGSRCMDCGTFWVD